MTVADASAAPAELTAQIAALQRCIDERDAALAETVLDADFQLVVLQPKRVVMPRQRWLQVLDDYVMHSYDVEERVVDVDGDLAAAVHRVRMHATVLGEDRSGLFVITDIWRRRPDGWRVWRRHSTPLAAGELPS